MFDSNQLTEINEKQLSEHQRNWSFLKESLTNKGVDVENLIQKISDFQIAIPSWALGTGGTRFGRFPLGGEPGNLEDKVKDVGLLHALNKSSGAISLHIPWDIPQDYNSIKKIATDLDLKFDAVNSNTF
jgi:L-rhamnose isomerase/sugar isomerase